MHDQRIQRICTLNYRWTHEAIVRAFSVIAALVTSKSTVLSIVYSEWANDKHITLFLFNPVSQCKCLCWVLQSNCLSWMVWSSWLWKRS